LYAKRNIQIRLLNTFLLAHPTSTFLLFKRVIWSGVAESLSRSAANPPKNTKSRRQQTEKWGSSGRKAGEMVRVS